MKRVRLPLIVMLCALALAACNRDEAEIAAAASGNPLLAHVPAGTP